MKLIDTDHVSIHHWRDSGNRVSCHQTMHLHGREFELVVSGWAPGQTTSWTVFEYAPRKIYASYTQWRSPHIKFLKDFGGIVLERFCTDFTTSNTGSLTWDEVNGYKDKRNDAN